VPDDTLLAAGAVAPTCSGPAWSTTVPGAVGDRLASFVTTQVARLTALDAALEPLARAAGDAVLGGGKRLRPLFAFWGWRTNGGDEAVAAILPALASLELLHAFALVHDDVMDHSDLRRGRPSVHRMFAHDHSRSRFAGDPNVFGESAAILVGDLCLVWADLLMADARIDPARLTAARSAYDDMRVEAVAGQFLDILSDVVPEWTLDRAMRTACLKTAAYTVTRPMSFGALLAGPLGLALSTFYAQYGSAVGEAFQLCDDLLGAFGERSVTGKPAGDDLVRGKRTALWELARSRAAASDLAEMEELTARHRDRADEAPEAVGRRLAEIVSGTGAPAAVRKMIEERIDEARRAVAAAPIDRKCRDALNDLAETVAWRTA
jgi:geranylgeranyl diphosphate synthase type I